MALPQQKRFSLDEATRFIEYETGVPHSTDGLLHLAKNKQIEVCFYIDNPALSLIEIIVSSDKDAKPLIPSSKDKNNSWTTPIINPRKENVFPILSKEALSFFVDNPDENHTQITTKDCSATYIYGVIPIAIITIEAESAEVISKYKVTRNALCVPYQTLKTYITHIQDEQNKPDRIQEAITEIREKTGRTFSRNQLFKFAKDDSLLISFVIPNSELQYVRMDDYKLIKCPPLHASLIIPKSQAPLSNVRGITGETIYPILEKYSLNELANHHRTEIQILLTGIQAKDKKGENLRICCCETYSFSTNRKYNECKKFIKWLGENDIQTFDEVGIDTNKFSSVQLETIYIVKQSIVELTPLDLFIPPFSLEQFIRNLQNKKHSATEEKRRILLKAWLEKQSPKFNPFFHDMTKQEVWDACDMNEGFTIKRGTTFSKYNRDLITYRKKRPTKKQLSMTKMEDLDKNNPAIMPLRSST